MKALPLLIALGLTPATGLAQNRIFTADQVAQLLVQDMSPTGSMEGGQWFTDTQDTYGLGIIYVHIPGSAGSVTIHAGIYGFLDSGWVKLRDVQGLFGASPTGAAFSPGRVEVLTMTLGPNDPRCCPTKQVRWTIDLETGQAVALN
jgi:hypothetical protein